MDTLGEVFREFERQRHAENVKTATAIAKEFHDEGMSKSQIEEMLCANDVDPMVIQDALALLPDRK